jgi:hypothetical protein
MREFDERHAVEALLRRFAEKIEKILFAAEGPDGDLTAIPPLLNEAREIGVVADPASNAPGYTFGVWGRICQKEGLKASLLALSILGEACAGFATAVHAQGLACLAMIGEAQYTTATNLSVVFMPQYGVPLSFHPPLVGTGLQLVDAEGSPKWNGTGHFLLAAEAPDKLVCYALRSIISGAQPEWVSLTINADAPGVKLTELEPTMRTGLRAVRQYHLRLKGVAASQARILCEGKAARRSLSQVLACDWLGQGAIALGVARRSLRDSRTYTSQRYQGGRLIEEHAAVQLLQGTAEYDISLLEAIIYRHADEPLSSLDSVALLRWAVQARLAVAEHAHRAVTNCLQTLGGYGYMEDYGLEKRLRDVSTLKSLHGAPDQLKLFLNQLAHEQ